MVFTEKQLYVIFLDCLTGLSEPDLMLEEIIGQKVPERMFLERALGIYRSEDVLKAEKIVMANKLWRAFLKGASVAYANP